MLLYHQQAPCTSYTSLSTLCTDCTAQCLGGTRNWKGWKRPENRAAAQKERKPLFFQETPAWGRNCCPCCRKVSATTGASLKLQLHSNDPALQPQQLPHSQGTGLHELFSASAGLHVFPKALLVFTVLLPLLSTIWDMQSFCGNAVLNLSVLKALIT